MEDFAGAFGDERRARAVGSLLQSMVAQSSVVVRQLGKDRAGEVSAHRALSSPAVTPEETLDCLARRTAQAVTGRRVIAVQDTTECNFPGRKKSQLGPAGRNGDRPGFFIHAVVAVDRAEEAVLGVVAADIWTRPAEPAGVRRQRDFPDKESHRWLRGAIAAAEVLASAAQVVVVGDRENDIYEVFAGRPERVELLVRAAQNRTLAEGGRLFAAPGLRELGIDQVHLPPPRLGTQGRDATVSLRTGAVTIAAPRHGRRDPGTPQTLTVTLVEAVETAPPPGEAPLHWRLLTTLPADTLAQAQDIVACYRLRWRIEQTFRMLKSDGLELEESQTTDPHRLFNLAALALGAAVRVIQLVDARDGSSRPASDVASETEIAAATALVPKLQGKTERQKNHHPPGSLAWLAWVVARLGGWNCYYKPPGPKTMRRGWDRFAAIAEGYALATAACHDV